MTTLGKRLKQARAMASLSQQDLANAISSTGKKISRTAIAQWESGVTKGVEAANLLKATHVLNVRPEWLQFGTGNMRPEDKGPMISDVSNMMLVPIMNISQAAKHMERDDIAVYVGLDQELAKVASPHSFAITITDDSMLPAIKQDDIIIIDPNIRPQPGEIVSAKLSHEDQIVIRKYRPQMSTEAKFNPFELIPLNEDWPRIIVNDPKQGHIIGTLIEHRCRRRIHPTEKEK